MNPCLHLFWRKWPRAAMLLLSLLVFPAYAQEMLTVTGTVTAKEDASPLPGMTVIVKNTAQGTATDAGGKYSIQAARGSVLEFRGVGYAPREMTVSGASLDVALTSQVNSLNEVYVIGYGSTTKQNLTTSVAKVDPKDVPQAANNNIGQLLFGRAAGLQVVQNSAEPGGAINISIRGRGAPLYVVDGVIYPGDALEPTNGSIGGETNGVHRGGLAGLNPEDIESIEFLKDASAAIYGVNAANGVVLITTKKGKAGRLNVSYSGSYSFIKNYPYLQPLTASQYETLVNQFATDQYLAAHQMVPYGAVAANVPASVRRFSDTDIANAGTGTNYLNEIFRTGAINNHQLSVNGGSEKATYFLSAGYYNEQGTLKNSGLTKYTGRANLAFNLTKFLTVGGNFSGSRNLNLNSSSGGQTGGSGSQGFGIIQAALGYPGNVPVYDPTTGAFSRFGVIANPVSLLSVQDQTRYNALTANVFTDIKFIPGMLTGHVQFGDNYDQAVRDFFVPSSVFYFGQNLSRGSINNNSREATTFESTLSYTHSFSENVNVDAVAGYGQYRNTYGISGSQGTGMLDAIGTSNLGASTGNVGISSQRTETKLRSYFGRASVDLLNRYLLTVGFRYDGYSLFFPDNKYAAFPSVSLGWKLNNEGFMKNLTAVNLLKVRASLGITGQTLAGNAAYGGYAPTPVLFFNNGAAQYAPVALYGFDHPELTWQKTTNKNIGLDFGLFKDRLTGSVDFFRDDITNLLAYQSTAPLSFLSTQPVNGGHQSRQGYDIGINTVNLKLPNFQWSSIVNVSHYVYQWRERFAFNTLLQYQDVSDPVNELYYFKTNGLLKPGQDVPAAQPTAGGGRLVGSPLFVDANGDGKLDYQDVQKLNPDPKVSIGFGNNFLYKNFDLSIFFYGQFGGQTNNLNYAFGDPNSILSSTQSGTIQAQDVYSTANPGGTRPSVNYIESATGLLVGSDVNLVSTNFVRCRNLTLGYTIKGAFVDKFSKSIRVFADAQNLFIVTNYKGVDPEVTYQSVKGGYAPYPMSRAFSFGVKASF